MTERGVPMLTKLTSGNCGEKSRVSAICRWLIKPAVVSGMVVVVGSENIDVSKMTTSWTPLDSRPESVGTGKQGAGRQAHARR